MDPLLLEGIFFAVFSSPPCSAVNNPQSQIRNPQSKDDPRVLLRFDIHHFTQTRPFDTRRVIQKRSYAPHSGIRGFIKKVIYRSERVVYDPNLSSCSSCLFV